MSYDATFRVWRGDAAGGDLQTFTVAVNEGEVVLDVIHRLQATQAGDLAVRWNCKAGKCGSCSAEINGRPRLMCMTRMSTFGEGDTVTVTPLRTFPVVRDLVTDVSYNYEVASRIPAFTRRTRRSSPAPASSSAWPSSTCTRWTWSTASTRRRTSSAWATATSPSAAARSARRASTSPTTGSSR